ncbi:MAG: response regulator transcription factor [Bacteroidetes bacterium]|nr:response regulator transcription factor [Bacteroidota bacterium]
MIKMIIIDDEQTSIDHFAITVLENFSHEFEIIGKYTDPDDGVEAIKLLKPDMAIIDMHFPNSSGLEIAKKIANLPVMPIFLTGKVEKIMDALEISDLYYMLKPIRRIDLNNILLRYKAQQNKPHQPQIDVPIINEKKIENAYNHIHNKASKNEGAIFLNSLNKIDIVDFNNITNFEANGQYTTINLVTGSPVLTTKPLAYFQNLIKDNKDFFRCHKSSIVNVNKIKKIEKTKYSYELILENDIKVLVSFLKKKELNDYIKGALVSKKHFE